MQNKYLNILFNIVVIIMIPVVIYGIIYEFFIYNKDIIPKNINNIITIIGFICLFLLIIIYLIDKFIFRKK